MERKTFYEDDLTEERDKTPAERGRNAHVVALDPAVGDDEAEDEDEDEDDDDLED